MTNEINLLLAQNPSFRFVRVTFGDNLKSYTYKTISEVQVDDTVIVDTPSKGFTTAAVLEVLELHEIDLNAHYQYKWVVQVVDITAYEELKNKENEAKKIIQSAKTATLVNAMKEDLTARIGTEALADVQKLVRL